MNLHTVMQVTDTILQFKDPYRNYHGTAVAELAVQIVDAAHIEATKQERELIYFGAGLHDIGKILIPDAILHKSRKLNIGEFETMKSHVSIGKMLAEKFQFDPIIADIIYLHHENVNGTGYLSGKHKEHIPWYVRVVSVVDAYSAMTSNRSYTKAMKPQDAIVELYKFVGSRYDIKYVDALYEVIDAQATKQQN